MIAWDPPGYGYSRPPERIDLYGPDIYTKDANLAAKLMEKLGYRSYSIMGWSDGGKTALCLAYRNPARVDKAVTIAGQAYVTPACKAALKTTSNIKFWEPHMLAPYQKVYGAEEFQTLWERHVEHYANNLDDICKDGVKVRIAWRSINPSLSDRGSFLSHLLPF